MANTPVNVGISPVLFVNDEVIEQAIGCSRRINPAVKHSNNPVFHLTGSDTHDLCQCMSVLYDEQVSLYKMWYNGRLAGQDDYQLFYATSTDGLNWECPNLGLYEFNGSKNNNVLADVAGKPLPSIVGKYTGHGDPADGPFFVGHAKSPVVGRWTAGVGHKQLHPP